jgi:hypothetical protein
MHVLKIVRKPGVPLVPAPFYREGYPCWTAELSAVETAQCMEPFKSGKPMKDVQEAYLDGKLIYPIQGLHW